MGGSSTGPECGVQPGGVIPGTAQRPPESVSARGWGRSQRAVPRLQQHALQKQPAAALQVRLVQPHGQVAEGEVAVGCVCQLLHHHALQAEFPAVHVGELAGDLVCKEREPPRTAAFAGGSPRLGRPAAILLFLALLRCLWDLSSRTRD